MQPLLLFSHLPLKLCLTALPKALKVRQVEVLHPALLHLLGLSPAEVVLVALAALALMQIVLAAMPLVAPCLVQVVRVVRVVQVQVVLVLRLLQILALPLVQVAVRVLHLALHVAPVVALRPGEAASIR